MNKLSESQKFTFVMRQANHCASYVSLSNFPRPATDHSLTRFELKFPLCCSPDHSSSMRFILGLRISPNSSLI